MSGLKSFPIIALMFMSGSFVTLECWSASVSDLTYQEIIALNATCAGVDSCELPRAPDTLEHCSCSSFCSLLGTCCIDSKHRHNYPKPLKNIHCEYVSGRKMHRFVPMIMSCDQDLEFDKNTEELCNSTGEALNDPFLKIPVTDPITGISYKNYYCFICNAHFGAEEPMLWNPEIKIKINDSSLQMLRSKPFGRMQGKKNNGLSVPNLHYDYFKRGWVEKVNSSLVPNLQYDLSRGTWVMDYNEENATDVEFSASMPNELKDVTHVCYELVFEMISECASDWMDENIERKCLAYMAVVSIYRNDSFLPRYYRNPHCAICNYESIDNMKCLVEEDDYGYGSGVRPDTLFIKLFYLKDETTNCVEGMVYDHFAKKCRRIYKAKKLN